MDLAGGAQQIPARQEALAIEFKPIAHRPERVTRQRHAIEPDAAPLDRFVVANIEVTGQVGQRSEARIERRVVIEDVIRSAQQVRLLEVALLAERDTHLGALLLPPLLPTGGAGALVAVEMREQQLLYARGR